MTKIHENAESKLHRVKIIQHLGTMFVDELRQGFQLYDNTTETNEIRFEELLKFRAFIL